MFDIVSALIGAVAGGGVTALLFFVTRRDKSRVDRAKAIDDIVVASTELVNAARASPVGSNSIPEAVVIGPFMDLQRALLRFEVFIGPKDKQTEWVLQYSQARILFPRKRLDRDTAAGVIGSRLIAWHTGRVKAGWFAEDLGRLAAEAGRAGD